jgi:hypothetical protein
MGPPGPPGGVVRNGKIRIGLFLILPIRDMPPARPAARPQSADARYDAVGGSFAPRTGGGAMSVITLYGVAAVTFMMVMYALEGRGRGFILAFAAGCLLSSLYGFLSGAWPFGVVEFIWTAVAVRRYLAAGGGRAVDTNIS